MPHAAHKKILIVEDEHDILQLVKLYLEKEGFRTVSAKTGTEGLRQVKQKKPDLVVLDLMLPEIDGLEVCKRLRSAPETAMLPIIMLTAKAEESDTIIGLELGADDYVTKPFSPKTLVARIKALFRRLERKPARARPNTAMATSSWISPDMKSPCRTWKSHSRPKNSACSNISCAIPAES